MFGESHRGESPRLPSPWRDIAACSPKNLTPKGALNFDSEAVCNALEKLRLSNESRSLIPESDQMGHIEYKLCLIASTPDRFQKLVTQLKWRLFEGGGEALYEIGVLDNGTLIGLSAQDLATSLATLRNMADSLECHVEVLREIEIEASQAVQVVDNPDLNTVAVLTPSAKDHLHVTLPFIKMCSTRARDMVDSSPTRAIPILSPSDEGNSSPFRTSDDSINRASSSAILPPPIVPENGRLSKFRKVSPQLLRTLHRNEDDARWCAEVRIYTPARARTPQDTSDSDDGDRSDEIAYLDFESFGDP